MSTPILNASPIPALDCPVRRLQDDLRPQPVAVLGASRRHPGGQGGLFGRGQGNHVRAGHRHLIFVSHPPPDAEHDTRPEHRSSGKMHLVVTYPDSTKSSLQYRLRARTPERWPQLASIQVHHRANFSYIDGVMPDGTTVNLCRLRYAGSAHRWGFAIYRASHDDYTDSILPTGMPVGTCQDALDTACGLYLADPTAWT